MNWGNARVFLGIARTSRLRGAARHLKVDQATFGRRLAPLEDELNTRLSLRTPSLYVLTPAGQKPIDLAETFERSVSRIERWVMGLDMSLV